MTAVIDAGKVHLSTCPKCGRYLTLFEADYGKCWDCEDAAAHYRHKIADGWQEVKNAGVVIDGTYSIDWGAATSRVKVIGFGDQNPAWVKVEEVQANKIRVYLVAVNLLKVSTNVESVVA